MKKLSIPPKKIRLFQKEVYDNYKSLKRTFKWRITKDPYHVLLSEFMLQQTQTSRVVAKYDDFIERYKDVCSLAHTEKREILELWQGLGYNRRALYLHETAKIICKNYNGTVPEDYKSLLKLPGVGPYTASAILTFAYNRPRVFIETNIRTAFIHYFFPDRENIKDEELLFLVDQTLDQDNPREWYYALMDYGVMIKKVHGNPNKRSKHYIKQSPFEGSNRQKRGMIVKKLTQDQKINKSELEKEFNISSSELNGIVTQLEEEGFLIQDNLKITLQ